ncbi:hypothetical protein EYF80_051976 [Liparis tanakae]|uniref:Uncharacterized protein n=1 Tax=Liparis tanakae TaxID=230148 RepID=A0A4Z2FAC0_9TELE|nr:hypothetical protein EYF80_051976 [Liparis tanakae]
MFRCAVVASVGSVLFFVFRKLSATSDRRRPDNRFFLPGRPPACRPHPASSCVPVQPVQKVTPFTWSYQDPNVTEATEQDIKTPRHKSLHLQSELKGLRQKLDWKMSLDDSRRDARVISTLRHPSLLQLALRQRFFDTTTRAQKRQTVLNLSTRGQ